MSSFVLILGMLSSMMPLASDAFYPAVTSIAQGLGVAPKTIQIAISCNFLAVAFMCLWHGPISDALGRKPAILASLGLFVAGALVCAQATSFEQLLVGRIIQGLSSGMGMIVARAVLADRLSGPEAQRDWNVISMLQFGMTVLLPMLSGWLLYFWGWRSVFLYMALQASVLTWAIWRYLPETHPPEARHPVHPWPMLKSLATLMRKGTYLRPALAHALLFNSPLLYVAAAPVYLEHSLGLSARSFGWLYVPLVAGLVCGAVLARQLVSRLGTFKLVWCGWGAMLLVALGNLGYHLLWEPSLTAFVLTMALSCAGLGLAMASLQFSAMDQADGKRGLASGGINLLQVTVTVLVTSTTPYLWDSGLRLALAMLGGVVLAGLVGMARRRTPQAA